MKYFFLLLLLIPTATALGVGVNPEELVFNSQDPQIINIVNPNDAPIKFNIRTNHFNHNHESDIIAPKSSAQVAVTPKKLGSLDTVILVEISPVEPTEKMLGMSPTIGVKAKIIDPDKSERAQTSGGIQIIPKQPLFNLEEIIITILLVIAVCVAAVYPYVKKKKIKLR